MFGIILHFTTLKRGFVHPPPHFLACRKKSCPALPLPAQKQFYSAYLCSENMTNNSFLEGEFAFHPGKAGKTTWLSVMQN
jgi:hypothetical protein